MEYTNRVHLLAGKSNICKTLKQMPFALLFILCGCSKSEIQGLFLSSNSPVELKAPQSPLYTSVTTNSITLSWESSSSSTVAYQISYNTGANPPSSCNTGTYKINSTDIIGTTHTVSGLSSDTQYSFTICALNSQSELSTGTNMSLYTMGEVEALYPNNGSNWMDYVKNDGPSIYEATDTACDPDTDHSRLTPCIHGGEKRKLSLRFLSSCDGVTITDSLGVFEWECKNIGGVIQGVTRRLNSFKGLKSLLNTTGFRNISVMVNDGTNISSSPAANDWWSNPIDNDISDNGNSLNTSGTIYLVNGSGNFNAPLTASYEAQVITADKVALVIQDDAILDASAHAANLNNVNIDGFDFSWVEGQFTGSDLVSIGYANAKYSQLRNSTVFDVANGAVGFFDTGGGNECQGSRVEDVVMYGMTGFPLGGGILTEAAQEYIEIENSTVYNSASVGFLLGGNHIRANNLKVYSAGGNGLSISNCNYCSITNVKAYDSPFEGIDVDTSSGTTLVNITTAATTANGILLDNSPNVHLHNASVLVSFNSGFRSTNAGSTQLVVSNLNTTGNVSGLIFNNGVTDNYIYNTLSSHSGLYSYVDNHTGNTNIKFFGYAWDSDAVNACQLVGSHPAPSLTDVSCTDSGTIGSRDWAGDSSNNLAQFIPTTLDLTTNHIVGPVSVDDVSSPDDTNGVSGFAEITDWSALDNEWRAWVQNSYSLGSTANYRCQSGDTCQIWDFRLKTSSPLLNTAYSGTSTNPIFANGDTCPAPVHGDETIAHEDVIIPYYPGIVAVEVLADAKGDDNGLCDTVGEDCYNVYLKHAFEDIGDNIGDEDGLCESGESCVYSPNIGSYQGEGDYSTVECQFVDGVGANAVTGIQKMMAYPTNGQP